MTDTEKLAIKYANMIANSFGESFIDKLSINPDEDAGTTIKKLMAFNIAMANRIDRLEAESEQLWDVIYPNG